MKEREIRRKEKKIKERKKSIVFYKGILYIMNPDQISRGKSNERKRNKKQRKENKRKKEKKRKDWLVLQKRKH